jgi:hypothetical protein
LLLQAYSKYMGGMLAFELQDWEEALRSLNFAKYVASRKSVHLCALAFWDNCRVRRTQ